MWLNHLHGNPKESVFFFLHWREIIGSHCHARLSYGCHIWAYVLIFAEQILGLVELSSLAQEGKCWWLDSHVNISLMSVYYVQYRQHMDHRPLWWSIPCCSSVQEAWAAGDWVYCLCCGVWRTWGNIQTEIFHWFSSVSFHGEQLAEPGRLDRKGMSGLVLRSGLWFCWLRGAHKCSSPVMSKVPRKMRPGVLDPLKGSNLAYWVVMLMDSITLSVRNTFPSHCLRLGSLCLEGRWADLCLRSSL